MQTKKNNTQDGLDPRWVFSVVRDIAILVASSWASVLIIGFLFKSVLHEKPNVDFFLAYFVLLFFLMITGFTMSACFTRKNRWHHAIFVAAGVWVVDAFGYFTIHGLDTSFGMYLLIRLFLIVLPMLLGCTLSYAFKK